MIAPWLPAKAARYAGRERLLLPQDASRAYDRGRNQWHARGALNAEGFCHMGKLPVEVSPDAPHHPAGQHDPL
jgi:hypothetical protein